MARRADTGCFQLRRRGRQRRAPGSAVVRATATALAAASLAMPAVAQSVRSYYVQPSLTLTQTLTDNGGFSRRDGEVEAITQIRPSVRISARGPRVQGSIDYAINAVGYARDSDRSEIQQQLSLTSTGGLKLIENRLFLDGAANVSQQAITPFGQIPSDPGRGGDNLTQVATYSLSPYLVGQLGSAASYRLGVSHAATVAADESRFDAKSTTASLDVSSGRSFGPLGWGVQAARTASDYDEGRRTENDTLLGTVSYVVGPDLVLRANAGAEWNDFRTVEKTRYDRYGIGAEWRPTERTVISAQVDDRFFGTGYNVLLQHRTPRTVWSFTASRDVSDINGRTTAAVGTAYDLFYAQFASIQPDPLLREQLVLAFLRQNGIPPNLLLLSDFLFASGTIDDRQQLSFALVGRRSTLTVAATRSRSSRADTLTGASDVFSDTGFVNQRGMSVNVAHRLTPDSSLSLLIAEQRSSGELDTQSTRQRSAVLSWSIQVGRRSSLSLSAKRTEFDSPTNPYDENALTASFTMGFY